MSGFAFTVSGNSSSAPSFFLAWAHHYAAEYFCMNFKFIVGKGGVQTHPHLPTPSLLKPCARWNNLPFPDIVTYRHDLDQVTVLQRKQGKLLPIHASTQLREWV
jgi:hypothetical protein